MWTVIDRTVFPIGACGASGLASQQVEPIVREAPGILACDASKVVLHE